MSDKKNIAVCFYGKTGAMARDGAGDPLDLAGLNRNFKDKILNADYNIDVYIHSWSTESKDELVKMYKPKDYIIEEEKYPPPEHIKPEREKAANMAEYGLWDPYMFFSRWHSSLKSVELAKNSGVLYDLIMITRFDVLWTTCFDFDKIDPDKITTLGRPVLPQMHDYWFVSKPDNIIKFSEEACARADGYCGFLDDASHHLCSDLILELCGELTFAYEEPVDCFLARRFKSVIRKRPDLLEGAVDYLMSKKNFTLIRQNLVAAEIQIAIDREINNMQKARLQEIKDLNIGKKSDSILERVKKWLTK